MKLEEGFMGRRRGTVEAGNRILKRIVGNQNIYM